MSEQRRKDPVRRVSVMIVVIVLAVIGTVLYNAISEKRAYDAQQDGAASAAAPATASGGGPTSGG
ncbi:hypothetical protein [Burkholderia glumae]|uniref:Uncharacterized protein n=1 Tax=Burkholderia glumae TaxID=337 RepID=A0AAQ0BVE1_BURGL|nr:hypothetical protein [Burkholderia glumae]ACR28205.1 Hypothetical protein bglu_1g10320 [Burkholderia glumae BGR1]AJY65136.1 hypothetical protein KS03_1963 [Burkholderia glumae LMG 2196 = ATCC 33617]KHJ62605.1 hypothetical protein NCPPB3923_12610 [Burkholderia glumae]MCM2480809.1 hypothetical protein [Burkholderia glumae]MCM2492504.1 hypothetical protein [Burkholderia glumae]